MGVFLLSPSTMAEKPVKPKTAFQQFQADNSHLVEAWTSIADRSHQFSVLWAQLDPQRKEQYEASAQAAAKEYKQKLALYYITHQTEFQLMCAEKELKK